MTELQPYLVAAGGMILLMSLWVIVQQTWKRTIPGRRNDDDALAGRIGCGDCGREGECDVADSTADGASSCSGGSEMGRTSV